MINVDIKKMLNMKIGILGAGKSGIAAAKLASNFCNNILLSDSMEINENTINGVRFESNGHSDKSNNV